MTVTGCDFFRKLAGRPTTAMIEQKRQEMVADIGSKAREKAVQDSLVIVARNKADSVAACMYIMENGIRIYTSAGLGGIVQDEVTEGRGGRYRVIVGSFKEISNAEKKMAQVEQAGDFGTHFIRMRNGMIAVAACPVDQIQNALAGFRELQRIGACPEDAWILKIE